VKRILLVDDDVASCNATSAMLRGLDCVVEIAPDGNTALRSLRRAVPDAVLVCLNIPDMSGGAFVEACHHERRCSNVPVVVMAVTPRAAVDAIRMGAQGCIRKPVDMGGVMAALQPLLHERHLAEDRN
jgi:two-component system response regulator PrrA